MESPLIIFDHVHQVVINSADPAAAKKVAEVLAAQTAAVTTGDATPKSGASE